jgi:hypothetical protein
MKGAGESDTLPAADEFGGYHAVLIGIDGYEHWPTLRFAEQDARDIGDLLQSSYGFSDQNVTRLAGRDATRSRILGALREKLENLREDENLLIYYAGHGHLDPLTESGYWVPVDGELYDDASWIPFTTITSYLGAANVRAKNVVVITDSCYGGSLARAGPTPGSPRPSADVGRYVARLAQLAGKRSRQVIASGGYEQVPDQSLFAGLLKRALEENEYPAVDLELLFFSQIYPQLRVGGQQEAIMTRIVSGPDVDGQFVLVRGQSQQAPPPELARLTVESDSADRVLINGEARGETPLTAALPHGEYVIRVERDGFLPYEEELALDAGETRVLQVRLERERAQPPRVEFEVSPPQLRAGGRYTLTWRTENARRVEISSLGEVSLSGSRELVADATASYELTAYNSDGQRSSARGEVSVMPALPSIDYFLAKPDSIEAGQPATLTWRANDAEVVYIDGFGSVPLAGLQDFQPSSTTTYRLVATNELKESVEASLTVAVRAVPPPEIVSFDVQPGTIQPGESAELSWVASGARAEVSEVGAVPLKGSQRVSPSASTVYTLSVRNAAGEATERTAALRVARATPQPPGGLTPDRLRDSVLSSATTSTLATRASIRKQGTLSMPQTYLADFDDGVVGSSPGSDVWFSAETATDRFFEPRNGVTLAIVSRDAAPGLAGCRGAQLGTARQPMSRLAVGTYLCLRTSEGRFAQIRIAGMPGPSPGTLTVEYVTWN